MHPKSFAIIFITYVYTIDIPIMGSHRDNMFHVYVIHSNCARLHNFFSHKCVQKWLKIRNRGGGGGFNKDVLGEKKIEELTIGWGGGGVTIIRDSRVIQQLPSIGLHL